MLEARLGTLLSLSLALLLEETLKYRCLCWSSCGKVEHSQQQSWTHARMSFFCLRPDLPFPGKFNWKNQNFKFNLKLGTQASSIIQNSMTFTFSVDWEYPFWVNLVPKFKIACLKWNWVPTVIQIYRIQWCYSLFLFLTRNTLFEQICPKKSKLSI